MNKVFRHPDLFTRKEAAVYLGVCLTTLDRLDVPRTRLRHRVFFKRDALDKWLDDITEKSNSAGKKRGLK